MAKFEGSGKVAIITGYASGVGLATTLLFLSHQYQVFGVDINMTDLSKIEEEHLDRFHFCQADLTKEKGCEQVVNTCVEKFGEKIDVLANVAGIMDSFASAETYTDVEFSRVMNINLNVPTQMIRAVLPHMKSNGGSIINVGSKASLSGASAGVAYTASKHALLGVTKHTAWRFREEKIRCNAVMPGAVETNISSSLVRQNFDQASYATLAGVHALNYVPDSGKPLMAPSAVANAILFLASDSSAFINGAAIPIDQGWSVI